MFIDRDARSVITESRPERVLLAAVVQQAVFDMQSVPAEEEIREQRNRSSGREEGKPDPHGAADFLFGEDAWFAQICDYLGISPAWVRMRLVENAERARVDPRGTETTRRAAKAFLLRLRFYRRWADAG